MIPSPTSLISGEKVEHAPVPQLGTISVAQLNEYHCLNAERRLVSLYGTCFDVTSSLQSYGPDGAYKEYAGHDITLAISNHRTQPEWLDRFVRMTPEQHKKARGWVQYFEAKYPTCATLNVDFGQQETWPELTAEEAEAFNKGCSIM